MMDRKTPRGAERPRPVTPFDTDDRWMSDLEDQLGGFGLCTDRATTVHDELGQMGPADRDREMPTHEPRPWHGPVDF